MHLSFPGHFDGFKRLFTGRFCHVVTFSLRQRAMGDLFEVLVLGGARQGNGPRRFVGNVRRPQQPQEMPEGDPREHLVHVLLNNLAGGVGLNQLFNLAGFGNAMHGNLGDYVLNQEGLAAIANQLFVEAEERGPPPMPEEELSKLPTVRVTKESIGNTKVVQFRTFFRLIA